MRSFSSHHPIFMGNCPTIGHTFGHTFSLIYPVDECFFKEMKTLRILSNISNGSPPRIQPRTCKTNKNSALNSIQDGGPKTLLYMFSPCNFCKGSLKIEGITSRNHSTYLFKGGFALNLNRFDVRSCIQALFLQKYCATFVEVLAGRTFG